MWVWMQRSVGSIKNIVAHARAGTDLNEMSSKLWFGSHIAIRDVARACASAALFEFESNAEVRCEALFLAAKHTFHFIPTLDVLQHIYGECPPVKDKGYFEETPSASIFDTRKAKALLNWKRQLDWRDFEAWEL